jgi:hypothetical protein
MKNLEQTLNQKETIERIIEQHTVKYTTSQCPFEIYETKEKLKVLQLVYAVRYKSQLQEANQ